ncbi:FISUMP domain-containing protein [Flavobacterium sp.]|uniref:FISUMP domain-containing protein n=1 Tax=Flavobacterium sp. TaxID=239 RepID=UPI002FDA6AC2
MKYVNLQSVRLTAVLTLPYLFFACSSDEETKSQKISIASTEISVSDVTYNSAKATIAFQIQGSPQIVEKGLVWGDNPNLNFESAFKCQSTDESLNMSCVITGLNPITQYYTRGYIVTTKGIFYSQVKTFVTSNTTLALIKNFNLTEVTQDSFRASAEIDSDGGTAITAKGFVWSNQNNPTLETQNQTNSGEGFGGFSSLINQLPAATQFYVRAYAINANGVHYSESKVVTTLPGLPVLQTQAITAITFNSSVSGGYSITDSGSPIANKGVVWSTNPNPTISLNTKTNEGTGTSNFTSLLQNLQPSTQYYVRAYATNSVGTSYGSQLTFTTSQIPTPVYDGDGNVYQTIQIGNQIWLKENLKTTRYCNGDLIPNVSSSSQWSSLTTPAWSNYNNSSTNGSVYGKLYNWYAIEDSRNICPCNYRVATESDFVVLENYLISSGYNYDGSHSGNKIAKSLASKENWSSSSNTGAPGNNLNLNNSTLFSAQPGGYRLNDGTFLNLNYSAYFWAFSTSSTSLGQHRAISNGMPNLVSNSVNKKIGFSVRCIKN